MNSPVNPQGEDMSAGPMIGFSVLSLLIPCAGFFFAVGFFSNGKPVRGAICLASALLTVGIFVVRALSKG